MEIRYTIIIPYRDKYDMLCKCVDSIIDREDVKIIIVDNSVKPLSNVNVPGKRFAKVFYTTSQPERGAGGARNEGLKYIEGNKVLFMDADDYLTLTAFETFDKFCDAEYDIVFFKSDSIRLKTGEQSNRHTYLNNMIDEFFKSGNEDKLRYSFTVPWCKMYSSELLKDSEIFFDEVKASNDLMFSARAGHKARKITACNDVVYVVTEGEANQSIIKNKSADAQFDRYKVAVSQCHFMESIGRKDLRFHLLSFVVHSLTDYGFKEFWKYISYAYKKRVSIFLR